MRERGNSGAALAAFVVPRPESTVEEAGIRRFLEQRLPPYMVPSTVALLERLPMHPTGKVDRKALAALETGDPPRTMFPGAPRTELERSIAAIWKEVLALPE